VVPDRLEYLGRVQKFINVLVESAKTNSITEQDFYLVLGAKAKSMDQERREQRLTKEIEKYIRKRGKVYKREIIEKFSLQWKVLSDIENNLIEKESIYIMNLKPLPGSGAGRSKKVYIAIK